MAFFIIIGATLTIFFIPARRILLFFGATLATWFAVLSINLGAILFNVVKPAFIVSRPAYVKFYILGHQTFCSVFSFRLLAIF